ncbi:unnamed protein product, partial [Rotaria sp. Silwood1]
SNQNNTNGMLHITNY